MQLRPASLLSLSALLLLSCLAPLQAPSEAAAPASFAGQVVVVTGANRGLGLEFARQLAARGATVLGTAREPEEATELAATGARVLQLDVTDARSVAAFADAVGDAVGDSGVDLLINNAGILEARGSERVPDLDVVARTLDVNLMGPMRVTYALLENLLATDAPRVVNLSSILGSIESNLEGGYVGYRESKAGLNMFTRSLAGEFRANALVAVALHPGWVSTDMGGPSAPLTPEESVRGLLDVIAGLGPDDSGRFLAGQGGGALPW